MLGELEYQYSMIPLPATSDGGIDKTNDNLETQQIGDLPGYAFILDTNSTLDSPSPSSAQETVSDLVARYDFIVAMRFFKSLTQHDLFIHCV